MRCSPWRWLWGVIPVALMSWLAVLGHRSGIEADLTDRTKTSLERSGQPWASVRFEGRDAVLMGRSHDQDAAGKALEAVNATWGVRTVENRSALLDKVDRYVWRARRNGDRLLLEGHVPSEAARQEIVGLVRGALSGITIDDKLQVARGAPAYESWIGGIAFALQQLARLPDGEAVLEQTELTIRGTTDDPQAHAGLTRALSSGLPKGIRLKAAEVRAPVVRPYVWSARSRDGGIELSGHLPDAAARSALLGVASGKRLDDRAVYASGEPPEFPAAAMVVLRELGRLDEGMAEIRDSAIAFQGIAADKAVADAARAALQNVPSAFRVTAQITHRLPRIAPYVTSARLDGATLALSGHAPSEAVRDALVSAAKAKRAGRDVRDGLEIGLGEPPTWQKCVELGLDALRQLGNGSAVLTNRRLIVIGQAASERDMQELTEALRDSAGPDCETATEITFPAPPPAQPTPAAPVDTSDSAAAERRAAEAAEQERRRAEAETLRQRAAAAEEQRKLAEEAARRRSEEAKQKAEDAQQKAAEARQKAESTAREKAAAAAEQKKRAEEEAERKRAAAVAVAEEAVRRREEADLRQRAAAAAAAEAEVNRRREIAISCQEKLRTTVSEGVILFDYAKSDIAPTSHSTLDRVAQAINTCPQFKIEIGGHTDTDGDVDRNQRLSERRAKAVFHYLIESGVSPERLSAVGYGQNRAVAPNDTAENKAKNRRIEFSVVDE